MLAAQGLLLLQLALLKLIEDHVELILVINAFEAGECLLDLVLGEECGQLGGEVHASLLRTEKGRSWRVCSCLWAAW